MNPRLLAACIATPLVLILGGVALAVPLPLASYSPGPTFDILGKDANGAEVVQVAGHKTYYDDGQLRFTTVISTSAGHKLSLAEALTRWFDPHDAVLPYDFAHPKEDTSVSEKEQGAVQMLTSQDFAKAAALRELGYKVQPKLDVGVVETGTPAYGKLEPRDLLLALNGKRLTSADQLVAGIRKVGPHPLTLTVQRGKRTLRVRITPKLDDGTPRIGIVPSVGYSYPFQIELNIDPTVGGPSAGLMFSLAIYDTLTPGSLTGGATIAGTGELDPDGKVGPIGGIAQKIAAADSAGAELFFVPADNCQDVTHLHPDGMRLVKATSMHQARLALTSWVADHDADLPAC